MLGKLDSASGCKIRKVITLLTATLIKEEHGAEANPPYSSMVVHDSLATHNLLRESWQCQCSAACSLKNLFTGSYMWRTHIMHPFGQVDVGLCDRPN